MKLTITIECSTSKDKEIFAALIKMIREAKDIFGGEQLPIEAYEDQQPLVETEIEL